jgi:dTDP-4-amino-4,6-dideoxygalactose transaminase
LGVNRIPVFECRTQYANLKSDILGAMEAVMASGNLILGPEVRSFEEEFSEFLGSEGDAVGVASGTEALMVALIALGIGRGDEVITVANTAVPTVSAIRSVGAMPVFCDADPRTCLMDLSRLPQLVTSRTRAVIPVHLYGNIVDVLKMRSILGDRPIRIVEDCAQAHGASLNGRQAGTLGDVGAFSFYPTKNLGACGDAGLCYSRDRDLVREMRRIRTYGFGVGHYAEREGVNSRLDELQAAILRVKLRHLREFVQRRRDLASMYYRNLPSAVEPVPPGTGVEHAYHLFVVRVRGRERLREALEKFGIGTAVHYPTPIHLMRGYSFLGIPAGSLPETEKAANEVLSLPLYPELPPEAVGRVCQEIGRLVN